MTRRSALTLVAAVVAMVPLLGAGASGAPLELRRATQPSASGADPYFPQDGNGGYQVRHYRIRDTYVPRTDRLNGHTYLTARATEDLPRFYLDLVLTPDRVLVNGRPARFGSPDPHTLRVTPSHPVASGSAFAVTVVYHGRPASVTAVGDRPNRDLFFHRPGETIAMGEPQNAPWWFPANETPQDSATFDIGVRVPRGDQAVANGELSSHTSKGGWAAWRWRMAQPMPTYLAFFAAGRFRLARGTADGHPYVYAVSRRLSAGAQRHAMHRLRQTREVVAWLTAQFGPYPFTSIGGVIPGIGVGYALETQSRPVYWTGVDHSTVVHEEAHQWFGDAVTLARWRSVWLNEGFATYAEHAYAADHGGTGVDTWLRRAYAANPSGSSMWDVRLGDPGRVHMWDIAVYVRGAMTLAALRNRIGAGDFGRLMRSWVRLHGHGSPVVSKDFEELAATVSGEDLASFFTAWLGQGRPADTTENGLG